MSIAWYTLTDLVDLRFDLSENNLQTAVFGFTSNVSENWESYFHVLGCLLGTDGPDYIELLSISPSGVATMAD